MTPEPGTGNSATQTRSWLLGEDWCLSPMPVTVVALVSPLTLPQGILELRGSSDSISAGVSAAWSQGRDMTTCRAEASFQLLFHPERDSHACSGHGLASRRACGPPSPRAPEGVGASLGGRPQGSPEGILNVPENSILCQVTPNMPFV